jgi:hypothetical protein
MQVSVSGGFLFREALDKWAGGRTGEIVSHHVSKQR